MLEVEADGEMIAEMPYAELQCMSSPPWRLTSDRIRRPDNIVPPPQLSPSV